MWLHVFKRPDEEWSTENYGFVLDTDDWGEAWRALLKLCSKADGWEYAHYEVVPGMRIEAEGYDRAYLSVEVPE